MKTDTLTTQQQLELKKLIEKSLLVPYKRVFLKRRRFLVGNEQLKEENLYQDADASVYAYSFHAQSFLIEQKGKITKVGLYLKRDGTPTVDLTVYLKEDASGTPGNTLTSFVIDKEEVGATYSLIEKVVDVDVSATRYWVYVPSVGSSGASYFWGLDTVAHYPDGWYRNSSGNWPYDTYFRVTYNVFSYSWESAIDIGEYLISVSDIFWNLDTEELNVFRTSNVTLRLRNEDAEFEDDNPDGLMYGRILRHSLVQVKAGYKKPDGTELLLYVFSGVVDDYKYAEGRRVLTVTLLGLNSLLDLYSAEDLPDNQVAGENLGTGDGSTKEFFTDNKGVGKVKTVYVAGVEKAEPTDYSVSQLNDKSNYAKVTFVTAPSSGQSITCDYTYWYQDKSFKFLVEKLLDLARITDREVEEVLFDNFIWNSQSWDTEAEFNACAVKSGIEVLAEGTVRQILSEWLETLTAHFNAGVIKDNISTANDEIKLSTKTVDDPNNICLNRSTSGDFSDSPKAVDGNDGTYAYKWREVLGKEETLVVTLDRPEIIRKLRVYCMNYSPDWGDVTGYFYLDYYDGSWKNHSSFYFTKSGPTCQSTNCWNQTWDGLNYTNVSKLRVRMGGGFLYYNRIYEVQAWRKAWGTGHFRSQEKALGVNSCFGLFFENHLSGSFSYTFKERRYSEGSWGDWIIVSNGNKINLTPGEKIQYDVVLTSNDGNENPTIYDVKTQYIDGGYTWNNKIGSQVIDCSTDLKAFGKLENWVTLNGKEIKFFTQSAPDNGGVPGTWEEEKEISSTNQIMSTCTPGTTRFLKWWSKFRTDDATVRALLNKVKANWATSTFVISLANFTGLTVRSAIEELANMPNYECGFDATGKYFFRSRVATEEVDFVLDWKKNLEKISEVDPGLGEVRNHIEATFGDYTKVMDVKLEGEDRPDSIDKYGFLPLTVYGRNLLANENVNIATGICMRYYGKFDSSGNLISFNLPTPKQRIRCLLMFVPQLDLGDTVEIEHGEFS